MPRSVDVLIEAGSKRVFACAADWPGWCRSGRDEDDALEALRTYGVRYAAVLEGSGERFAAPTAASAFAVVERTEGNATTDFGAPDGVFDRDGAPVAGRTWGRWRRVLEASWAAFDAAALGARGVTLSTGPRGGGRKLDAIVGHVVGAEASYLKMLAGTGAPVDEDDAWGSRRAERDAVLAGLERARAGDVPEVRTPRRPQVAARAVHAARGLARARPRLGDRGSVTPRLSHPGVGGWSWHGPSSALRGFHEWRTLESMPPRGRGGSTMQAVVGDRLRVRSRHIGEADRDAEIIEVRGEGGTPPFLVRWADGHVGLMFPESDAEVVHVGEPGRPST